MSDNLNNNITYDDDWKSVTTTEYAKVYSNLPEHSNDEEAENEDNNTKKPKKSKVKYPRQYLITFQLIACIIIALIAFAIKGFGGEVYALAREWYYSNLNSSIIFEADGKQINLDNIFSDATKDEI